MTVTFITHHICSRGHDTEGVLVAQVRVNKGTLRSTSPGIGGAPFRCRECQEPLGTADPKMTLVPEDAEKVRSYRQRKWGAA